MSKFLIVDDNKDIQFLLQKIMERHDHEVVLADNGAEALEKARHNPPDIIVSDILMPVMDGFTLCRKWKSDDILKKIPFVFYTATYIDEEYEEAALKAGADRFLRKSIKTEEFMDAVIDVLNSAEHVRVIAANPDQETEEEESYKLYNDRLVIKLEERTLELEQEIAGHRRTEDGLKLNQMELEMQNEELRKTHKMLETSRSRYADLYNYAPVGYFSFDKKGVILDVNLTCAEMLGIERSSLIKKTFSSFVVRDDQDILYLHCKEVLKTGASTCNLRIARNDASEFLAQLESIGVKESEGNCNHCRTAITDITDRKKAEEKIQWLAKFPDENVSPMLRVTKDGKMLYANRGSMSLLNNWGCEVGQFLPDDWCKFIQDVFSEGLTRHIEEKYANTVLSLIFTPVTDSDYVNIYGLDITEQKRAEEELRQHREQLETLIKKRTLELSASNEKLRKEIDERKEAEKALQDSEEKYRAFFEQAPDSVCLIDAATGDILTFNDKTHENLGYSREEFKELKISDFEVIESEEDVKDHIKQILEQGHDTFETKHRKKNGQIRNILVNTKLIPVGENKFIQSIWTDITDIKQAENQLKLMALFAELNPSPVLRFNRDGEVLMANPASLKTFGRESLIGVPLKSILPGIEKLDLASCIQNSTILSYPIHIGSRFFHFTLRGVPSMDIGHMYGDDITELRQAEGALLKSEDRYRRITESITDYIYTVHIEKGSPFNTVHGENCLAITGYTKEEFSDDHYLWIHMVLEEDHELVLQQVEDVLAGNFPQSIQHRIVRKDGEIRWVESMMVPNYDFDGDLISYDGLIRDITTRKRLEEQLVHSQKMESIGTLAGGVAHDFNNILTAIIGFSSILTRKIPEDNPSRFYIDQIQLAAESAANLTGSLLAFGRKQKINPMPLDVNMMIKKVEKLLSRLIREDIVFRTVPLDENLNVMADFSQMQQVLMNLVSNARDAMPEGGLLLLTSESFRIDNEFVRSRCFGKPGEYVLIAISDTGIGIDEMSKEKIFEPFYTSKEMDKGTGLGLSIVYGIIKEHKGYIEVDSELNKGTTVKIYLPMIETGKDKSIDRIEDVMPRGGRETVLLVEDNSMIRQFLVSELTEFGYRLIVAKDGEEALYKFREHKDDIQFLITDVIMPKKSGKEVYAEILKIRPDIKALFLSGYSEEMLKNECVFIKEMNFMSKPVKPYDLLRKIREILDEDK